MPHPPTFEHIHRNLIPKKDGKNELVPYKKDLMSLISSIISNRKSGRPKLILTFLFWFEEDVISLYNEFKLENRSVYEKERKIIFNEKKCSQPKEYCEKHTYVLR